MALPRRNRPGNPSPRPGHGPRATLFATGRGSVMQCACCTGLEIRFGNALMALAASELDTVLTALAEADAADPSGGRGTTLTLGETGCGWVFDPDEVAELHRLVAGARLLLDVGDGPAA